MSICICSAGPNRDHVHAIFQWSAGPHPAFSSGTPYHVVQPLRPATSPVALFARRTPQAVQDRAAGAGFQPYTSLSLPFKSQTSAVVNAYLDGGGFGAGATGDRLSTRSRLAHHQPCETAGAVRRAASNRVGAWALRVLVKDRVSKFVFLMN